MPAKGKISSKRKGSSTTRRRTTTSSSGSRAARSAVPSRAKAATRATTATRRRRKATTSRAATARTPRQPRKASPPRIPAGQRLFVLEVPWELRRTASFAGAQWQPSPIAAWTWIGVKLPAKLAPFDSLPFSPERWKEDELNGRPRPAPPAPADLVPRPHQREAATVILAALRAGRLGFLLADDTGLGKTISAWAAALAAAARVVLICCPLSVIPHWRATLLGMGTGQARVLILNYDRLKQLLEPPPEARRAVRRRTRNQRIAANGTPRIHPDLVIPDEAHALRHPDSQRSQAMAHLTAGARFVLYLSATAGQSPLELAYLGALLGQVTGEPVPGDQEGFVAWCEGHEVQVEKASYGRRVWKQNDRDIAWMQRLLFEVVDQDVPLGLRRLPTDIAGWPELRHLPMPVALDVHARLLYATAWREFRRQMGLAVRQQQAGKHAKAAETGRLAKLRFRQKCSLLRVPGTAQLVADQLDAGRQVFVSVEFLETLDALQATLAARRIRCAVITGEVVGAAREQQRLAFQRGQVKVVLSTITEGISLHAGEELRGRVLSTAPRVTAIHDVRYSGLALSHISGRCHRDGQAAPVLWLYGEGTVDEHVVGVAVPRMRTMKAMHGDSVASFDRDLEAVLSRV
jgi:SNF2-related domain